MNDRQDTRVDVDRHAIVGTVIGTIGDLVQDWEIDEPIGSDTRVVADLGFESIDLIQMVAALEQAFRPHGLSLVDMLVTDGRYVSDLTIGQIADAVASRMLKQSEK